MARVIYTSLYNGLNSWPGRLFEVLPGSTIQTETATNLTIVHPAGHPFAGFKIVINGTNFTYFGSTVTGGTVSMVRVLNDIGQTVLQIDQIPANTLASDLSQLVTSAAGFDDGQGGGAGPDGKLAWSHILSGDDRIYGTGGDDHRSLQGVDVGNDVYFMGAGNDWVMGGIGNDTINGGAGTDGLDYSNTHWSEGATAFQGVRISVGTGTAVDPWGGVDRFTSIEEFYGSRFDDRFTGTAGRERFAGLRGDDTFNGGGDRDTIDYSQDRWYGGTRGIYVDLQTGFLNGNIYGVVRDGFGNIDRTINIERVIGTPFNDTFIGSTDNNVFGGGEGVDLYRGDAGFDQINFSQSFTGAAQTGVNVDLRLSSGQIIDDGFGNTETALGIEGLWGTNFNDRLFGNGLDNYIYGGDGTDRMYGAGGADEFEWYGDNELGDGDIVYGFVSAGVAATHDRLSFDHTTFTGMTTTLTLVNGAAATSAVGTFVFNAATSTLYWDSDGTGGNAMVDVVMLNGVTSLSTADIVIF